MIITALWRQLPTVQLRPEDDDDDGGVDESMIA